MGYRRKAQGKGISKPFNYFSKAFVDPETGNRPTDEASFAEIVTKVRTAPVWNGSDAKKGQATGSTASQAEEHSEVSA